MTKVTLHETPSSQAVAKASQEYTVTDALGRNFVIRKPGLLAQYRIVDMLGPETAKNEVFVNMVLPLIYVASIDNDPIDLPATRLQLDALIQRVESVGLDAISKCLKEHFAQPDPEAQKQAIKK